MLVRVGVSLKLMHNNFSLHIEGIVLAKRYVICL